MVDPTVIGVGATIVALGGAAAYSYLTGDSAGADVDGDGEEEVTFDLGEDDPTEDYEKGEQPAEDAEPDVVVSKDDLTDVKGIGDTRAADLADAGFEAVTDLYYASDSNLTEVDGIGQYTVDQIREDIGGIDQNPNGESDEEPEGDSQDSTDQDSTNEQSESSDESESESTADEASQSEESGSDSGQEADSTGNDSRDEGNTDDASDD